MSEEAKVAVANSTQEGTPVVKANNVTSIKLEVKGYTDRVMALKRLRLDRSYVQSKIEELSKYIEYFNSIGEFDETVWDHTPLSSVSVLNEVGDFILPSVVRKDITDRKTKDVLVRAKSDVYGNFLDYTDLCDEIRGWFRSDASGDVTKLSDLRKAVNTEAIISKVAHNGKVAYVSQAYVPIVLKLNISDQFEDRYFNATVGEIISDYISNVRFN